MANILIVYQTSDYRFRATTRDHLYCFRNYSGHRCFYLNVARWGDPVEPFYGDIPAFTKRMHFDLVIFYVDLLGFLWPPYTLEHFTQQLGELKYIKAVKAALIQDEYYNTQLLDRFIREYEIEYVFSLAPESEWSKIYPATDFQKVKFFRTLPGYLDEKTLARIDKLSSAIQDRPIDIGYRAHGIRHWLGKHGYLKIQIADEFTNRAPQSGLNVDISTRLEDTFLGDTWYEFLLRCKYTISVEGGASIQDRDGAIRAKTEAYLQEHPGASFDEVERNCFPGKDGHFNYMAISPKHLETCATRTCQVLIEGDYNGILTPGLHYIELKRDFSNIDQVLEDIKKDHLRSQITDRAYHDIVESGLYTYRNFVRFILERTLPDQGSQSLLSEVYGWIRYLYGRLFEVYQRIRVKRSLEKYYANFLRKGSRFFNALTSPFRIQWYRKWWKIVSNRLFTLISSLQKPGPPHSIKTVAGNRSTKIDEYWSEYTVYAPPFQSAFESRRNLEWRFEAHPLFKELSGLYGQHEKETILDYGCGPGNDITGFAIFTQAEKIIGMDISIKSLSIAAHRLSLHRVPTDRIELVQVSDAEPKISLPEDHVDFINCQGVLMHTSDPAHILKEFFRVLKPGGSACIMVYNQDSVWFHLYTAYEKMILNGEFAGLSLEDAFSRTTDGFDCPMARSYSPEQFIGMCEAAGFKCEYMGGYFTETELTSIKRHLNIAIDDARLPAVNKQFLTQLQFDAKGFPKYHGCYAGVSGVYRLSKGDQ